MLEGPWRAGKQERLRLYWKVREERKQIVREKYERLKPHRGERGQGLWAANEALSFGPGGVRAVAEALPISTHTILWKASQNCRKNRGGQTAAGSAGSEADSVVPEVDGNPSRRNTPPCFKRSSTSWTRPPGGTPGLLSGGHRKA
jgi:hypothetical protein